MLITNIENGTLFAAVKLDSVRHMVANNVERVLGQENIDKGLRIVEVSYEASDGKRYVAPCELFGEIIVVRPIRERE